jgi:multicomponent Na+:H+ antiporter subunit B
MKTWEPEQFEREPHHRRLAGSVLVGVMAVILGATVWSLPREHASLPAVAREALTVALPKWHTLEPVNEVVYGTRGFDTFGETFLLLAAVVGIGLIARRREPRRGFIGEAAAGSEEQQESDPPEGKGPDEKRASQAESEELGRSRGPMTPDNEPLGTRVPEHAQGMSVIVRGGVRVVAPVLGVAGLYLVAWGYSPGGGFPGGGVILGLVLLAYVSLGYNRIKRVIRPDLLEPIEMGGALLIVLIEFLGLVFKGSFSANFLPLGQPQTIPSGGILQAFSGGELMEVATGLTLATFALLGMAHDWSPDEDDDDEEENNDDLDGGSGGEAEDEAGTDNDDRLTEATS